MAFLGQTYNVQDVPERTYDPIAPGWYTARIVEAELKQTQSGGDRISIKFSILGPSFQGRSVYVNINIRNANPKAEEIARQELGSIQRSLGIDLLSDTDQLLNGDLQIKISVRKNDKEEDVNDVKGYKPLENAISSGLPISQPSLSQQAASSTPSKSSPPWKR